LGLQGGYGASEEGMGPPKRVWGLQRGYGASEEGITGTKKKKKEESTNNNEER